jgi:hypothetical protein
MNRILAWLRSRLVQVVERYVFLADDGYVMTLNSADELQRAVEADMRDEAARQEMPDYSEFFWVLNINGVREVFAIAREEPDDEVALLTLAANTNFTIRPDDTGDEE